jgi:single-stranded DNA-binding protein
MHIEQRSPLIKRAVGVRMSGIEAAFFGSLGRDAERKTSKTGKSNLRLNVRVGDGDTAQWVGVTAFDERAIEIADKRMKGARVYGEGRLSDETGQDGAKRHGISVMSWHCRLSQIGRNKSSAGEGTRGEANNVGGFGSSPSRTDSGFNDEIPF